MHRLFSFLLLLHIVWQSNSVISIRVDPVNCLNRPIHELYNGHGYYFTWEDLKTAELQLSWAESREFCRSRCMDLVSLETKNENEFIKQRIAKGNQKFSWTSGRKCNFAGCDRPDLKPINVYGWFWSGSLTKMPPTTNRIDSDWSDTGALGRPQPDNREQTQGGPEEECLAILNNLFDDGVRWHDIACAHRKPFICEDSDELLNSVQAANPSYLHSGYPTTSTTTTTSTTRKSWMEPEPPPPPLQSTQNPIRN